MNSKARLMPGSIPWNGHTGFIDATLLQKAVPEIARRRAHICGPPVMMDAVYPLAYENKTAGYLMVSFSGDLVDKILDVVPRLHNGKLLLAEVIRNDSRNETACLWMSAVICTHE